MKGHLGRLKKIKGLWVVVCVLFKKNQEVEVLYVKR